MNLDERITILKELVFINDDIICNMKKLKMLIPIVTEYDKDLEETVLVSSTVLKLRYIQKLNDKIYKQVNEIQEVYVNE